ncbi:hypothetical protein [Flavobacterium poyangense]|uniref:hypothetical protein n=1 Tax=Flavobacterium poyangense TaxID=2204302 RepID=UPI00141EE4C8|nr:hypothetical protein [Flavobacterium sp. JXAS1]
MKKSILLLIMATTGLFSCKQGSNPTPKTEDTKALNLTESAQSPKTSNTPKEKYIDTKYEYTDATGARLIIQNSLPKGGLKYTDPTGKNYIYVVFWTRITNETIHPVELTLDFPLDSFELPASSGNYMKLRLPSDTITIDKVPLFDYGLAVKSFLDNGIDKASSLKRTINPKESSSFYVVAISNLGVNGTIRTGLRLKEQNLFYNVNGKEIPCGQLTLKNAIPKSF